MRPLKNQKWICVIDLLVKNLMLYAYHQPGTAMQHQKNSATNDLKPSQIYIDTIDEWNFIPANVQCVICSVHVGTFPPPSSSTSLVEKGGMWLKVILDLVDHALQHIDSPQKFPRWHFEAVKVFGMLYNFD